MNSSAKHPSTFDGSTLIFVVLLSIFGAIIGIQLLITLGVTPNTSIIGALAAMILARVPLTLLRQFRSIHVQNLAQTAISSATFGAANSLLLPIAIPFLMGRPDLIVPMFIGVGLAMLLDGYMLYRLFDTRVFPASGAWPPGVAAAEAIKAGDSGGTQAKVLGAGIGVGVIGAWLHVPMSAFGIAFLGNVWALTMFGIGLLIRGYAKPVFGMDINALYIPHGLMIGAGLVALIQVVGQIRSSRAATTREIAGAASEKAQARAGVDADRIRSTLRFGAIAYVALAALVAFGSGLYAGMSWPMLILFVVYAAFAALAHELIVGIAAMHSGWFPAFAVALITLLIGMLIGFPPLALTMLCGFAAATGPAFADMGYDLKAGYVLRGNGSDPSFELDGRRQQLVCALIAFIVAIPIVYISYQGYFSQGQTPPVAAVYAATIKAGIASGVGMHLALWAIPGAVVQWLGGPKRQIGVLLSTGLLIANPVAGWAVLVGIALRLLALRLWGDKIRNGLEVFAAGTIAGDAIYGFFNSMVRYHAKVK
jgi:uncharacterized oligopeptide transporter (OPT) family protein